MRQRRVAEQIRDELAGLLRDEVKDPRVGFASIVKVDVSGDLRIALVSVSVFGNDDEKQSTLKGLESATGFLRSELARRIRLRHVPELRFVLDDSIAHGAHISRLIRQIRKDEDPGRGTT